MLSRGCTAGGIEQSPAAAQAQQRGPAEGGPASQGEVPGGLRDSCQRLLNLSAYPHHPATAPQDGPDSSDHHPPFPGRLRSLITSPPPFSRGVVIYKLRRWPDFWRTDHLPPSSSLPSSSLNFFCTSGPLVFILFITCLSLSCVWVCWCRGAAGQGPGCLSSPL